MKQPYLKRAFNLFEAFKSKKINLDDLNSADAKSVHLNDKMNDFKLLVQMAKDTISGKYKMNTWNASIIVGTIVYVISPIDALPDFIPLAGWVDDITIVGYALTKLSVEIKKYKEHLLK